LKDSVIGQFFRKLHLSPFADMTKAENQPLELVAVRYGAIPNQSTGWIVAGCFILFIASFASGPGVCVWLALSELMPTRIRSNGMSIALLVNQAVSTTIAAVFLPTVGNYGYSAMFFFWAGCTVIYFITAAFFLPETKGKTLEEIEEHFEGKKAKA
jgi:phage shock protein PspC (stress-responsive transcriptional regulator)